MCNALNIEVDTSLHTYLEHKDTTRLYQSEKKSTLKYKRVCTYRWKAKVKEALYRESVDTNVYASGIGFESYTPNLPPTDKLKRKRIWLQIQLVQ